MNPALFTISLVAAVCLTPLALHGIARYRRAVCDACRTDGLGLGSRSVPHSCSRGNALYRDGKGNVYEFGRLVKHHAVTSSVTNHGPRRKHPHSTLRLASSPGEAPTPHPATLRDSRAAERS